MPRDSKDDLHLDGFALPGGISYSLYLVHVFVGQLILGMLAKYVTSVPALKWVVPPCAVAIALLVAYVFYRLVECPAKSLSSRLRYRPQEAFNPRT